MGRGPRPPRPEQIEMIKNATIASGGAVADSASAFADFKVSLQFPHF